MGHRAMRLRFLDMEPEESLCRRQNRRRALRGFCAALASRPGRSHGQLHPHGAAPDASTLPASTSRFLDLKLLQHYLQQMVKMSPLQSYMLEVVPMSDAMAVTGAAVMASQAAGV